MAWLPDFLHSLWTNTMNRCLKNRHLRACALLLTASVWMSLPHTAWAQTVTRQFPSAAVRGTLVVIQAPQITIDGKPERLSPGARIKGTNNLLVTSGTLVGQPLLVNYLREPQGLVHQVWILTEAEAREKRPGIAPK
jgi:hypothetical protein